MLLACAIGLALIITILPLVLTLFAIFLLLKWASNSGSWGKKATAAEQATGHE
jgi:flagellar basal body-associated protein FliL